MQFQLHIWLSFILKISFFKNQVINCLITKLRYFSGNEICSNWKCLLTCNRSWSNIFQNIKKLFKMSPIYLLLVASKRFISVFNDFLIWASDLEEQCQVSTDCRLKTWSHSVLFIYVINWKNLIEKSWNLSEFVFWSSVLHANGTNAQKNHMNCNLIFIAMNGHFSLRWIFIAKIFFIAMNSLLADKYNVHA